MYDIIIGRSEDDRKKYGTKGAILLGKHYVTMGQTTSLSNNIYMDITTSHVVFVCGKRGGGKCLHGDTIITLGDGSQVPIKDLERDNREIFSLNQDLKMQQSEKSGFYKRPVNKLLRVKLRSGKEIMLTPEHPLLTVRGWMPVEKLNIGARVATPRKIEAFGREPINEEEVKLIAYLTAEGHLSNNFVLFSNSDNKIIEDFKAAVKGFDENLQIKIHSKEGCYRIVENKKGKVIVPSKRDEIGRFTTKPIVDKTSSIRKWADEIGMYGKLAHEKVIPEKILKAGKQKTSLFLNRLFSCDGCIYEKSTDYWQVSYCSSSNVLIKQVQHLLLKLGIISSFREKKTPRRPTFELQIDGEHVHTFLNEIGFFGKKEQRSQKALERSLEVTRNPNIDTIPKEIWGIYHPDNWAAIGRKMGYKIPKSMRESTRYAPSRQKLLQIAKADESDLLCKLATSEIFWDEIVSLEVEEGRFMVYDITVPEHHNFVANDIIVHNSYTLGVIAEGLSDLPPEIKKNLSIIMLDTMGIYWTMKYPNRQDEELLRQWGIKSHGLDVQIYTPTGYYKKYKEQGIATDFPFSIKPSELSASDWCITFEISMNDPMGILIEKVVLKLGAKGDFSLEKMVKAVEEDEEAEEHIKNAVKNRLKSAESWGLFAKEGTPLKDLVQGGQVTILDISCYATIPGAENIRPLVIGLVAQKLFVQRMIARKEEEYNSIHKSIRTFNTKKDENSEPLVWLVIDEAHNFLPKEGKTTSSHALITILREGRQPGISLIMATQQPGKIHTDVMTQSDIVLSHRITANVDVEALGMLMQSYMREGLDKQINILPRVKGAGIIFDDTNERLYAMRVRPRFTWHGGGAPTAMREKETENEL